MVSKRGLFIFAFVLLSLFIVGVVSAESCYVSNAGTCIRNGDNPVLELSSTYNAHGSIVSLSSTLASDIVLCCDFPGDRTCTGSNKILGLSSTTNAHAQVPTFTGYSEPVCYGDLSCTTTTNTVCPSNYPIQTVSLSSSTNAHLGTFSTYPIKICCNNQVAPAPGPVCGNAMKEAGEQCDDGNTNSYDGCSYPTCQIETGYTCSESVVNGPSCCYDNTPYAYWTDKNGALIPEDTPTPLEVNDIYNMKLNTMFCGTGTGLYDVEIYRERTGLFTSDTLLATVKGYDNENNIESTWLVSADAIRKINNEGNNYIYFKVLGTPVGDVQSYTMTSIVNYVCGDGFVDSSTEQCDDGNTVSGDGCSDQCQIEPSYSCTGEPSVCNIVGPVCGNNIREYPEECDGTDLDGGDCSTETGMAQGTLSCYAAGTPNECTYDVSQCAATLIQQNCGNGAVDEYENCDDGNTVSGDGCSSTCQIETGYTCSYEPSVCSPIQPQDTCQSLGYECGTVNGEVCGDCGDPAVAYCSSGTCLATPDSCTSLGYECGTVNGEVCGTCGTNEQCSSGTCTALPSCSIDSASWSATDATEGDQVTLDVQTSNCGGKSISFLIKEDDGLLNPDDDVNVNPSPQTIPVGTTNSLSATWTSEFQDDTDGGQTNPPEYYFTVTVDGKNLKSSNELSVISQSTAVCIDKTSCSDYSQTECGADPCNLGIASVGGSCGLSYNDTTRCTEISNCGCVWDNADNVCKGNREITTQCGTCGNGVTDTGEQCDDGNTVSGDGCSSTCQFEGIGPNVPCPEGTTLCSDGTCSIECKYTDEDYSSCNYDGVCDTGTEGCTCSDCNLEQDSCEQGTVCYTQDSFCCNPQSDGICEPYCGYADPDCGSSGKVCGNGYRESGEQCDDGNTVSGDGCSATCTYEIIGPGELCPEGTALCSDGTCSINCFATDEGYSADPSGDCAPGLTYSQIDNACCNSGANAVCNPYCAYTDPDCGTITPSTSTGKCVYTDNSNDNCDDNILERDLTATWVGEGEKPASCKDITDKLVCPAQIKVSYFGALQFAIAVILVVLIYFIIRSRIKEEQKKKTKKKRFVKKKSKKK